MSDDNTISLSCCCTKATLQSCGSGTWTHGAFRVLRETLICWQKALSHQQSCLSTHTNTHTVYFYQQLHLQVIKNREEISELLFCSAEIWRICCVNILFGLQRLCLTHRSMTQTEMEMNIQLHQAASDHIIWVVSVCLCRPELPDPGPPDPPPYPVTSSLCWWGWRNSWVSLKQWSLWKQCRENCRWRAFLSHSQLWWTSGLCTWSTTVVLYLLIHQVTFWGSAALKPATFS